MDFFKSQTPDKSFKVTWRLPFGEKSENKLHSANLNVTLRPIFARLLMKIHKITLRIFEV